MSTESLVLAGFDKAPVGLQVVSLEDPADLGSFTTRAVNETACVITGQNLKADVGRCWRDSSPELADSEFARMYAGALRDGAPVSWEVEYEDSRFGRNWWRGTATPIDARSLVVVFQNVTEEKATSRRLVSALEVSAELARSNRDLDQFAYVASHDLKAPLRDVENLARWIADDAGEHLPSESRRHLDRLRGRIRRMEALLDDLLAYSRAGRVFEQPEPFDAVDAIRDAAALMAPSEKGFAVVLPPDGPWPLRTPRAPLSVVLANLIGNAVKHHDDDRGRIEVGLRDAHDLVEFIVRDDGPGIAPEFRERVFGMFQTLRPRDEVEGTGMGLALARRLVEGHGGTIGLESGNGRGAAFRFTWPRQWPAPGGVGG